MSGTKIVAIALIVIAILVLGYVAYTLTQGGERTGVHTPTKPVKGKPVKGSKTKPKPKPPKPSETEKPRETEKPQTSRRAKYSVGIFNYKWVKYRVKVKGNELTYTYENLGEESVNGRPCYHVKVTVEGPQRSEMEVWYSKDTGECVKAAISVPGYGRREIPCSAQAGILAAKGEEMKYVGEETVSVPAGTFQCSVFEGKGYKAWVSKDGLLVKWESGESEGVLLGYG